MAKMRVVSTKLWTDNYIVDLDPSEKLVFIYLLTNNLTNICGIYEISLRQIAFDTGFDIEVIKKIIARFTRDKKVLYQGGVLAIKNFIKNQNQGSPQVRKGIERELKEYPIELQKFVLEGIDTLSYLTKLNLTKPNLIQQEVETLWIRAMKRNPSPIEFDETLNLVKKHSFKKIEKVFMDAGLRNIGSLATIKKYLTEDGVLLSYDEYQSKQSQPIKEY